MVYFRVPRIVYLPGTVRGKGLYSDNIAFFQHNSMRHFLVWNSRWSMLNILLKSVPGQIDDRFISERGYGILDHTSDICGVHTRMDELDRIGKGFFRSFYKFLMT